MLQEFYLTSLMGHRKYVFLKVLNISNIFKSQVDWHAQNTARRIHITGPNYYQWISMCRKDADLPSLTPNGSVPYQTAAGDTTLTQLHISSSHFTPWKADRILRELGQAGRVLRTAWVLGTACFSKAGRPRTLPGWVKSVIPYFVPFAITKEKITT